MKKIIIVIVVVILLAILGFFILNRTTQVGTERQNEEITSETETPSLENEAEGVEGKKIIGNSVEGRDIEAYTYGTGANHILFVGGIHGGYSWNTALVAYELIDYLELNPTTVPSDVKLTVIPVLNPDGLHRIAGTSGKFSSSVIPTAEGATVPGRFNGNDVDLNRNFDCDWQADATWQDRSVSGGSAPFSEPEANAIKRYIETNNPRAVVVWYSSVGGVFASNCHEGVLPKTLELTNIYADASGYSAHEEFDFYEITGDMTNWLAKIKVPAISVLLTNHRDIEWDKNLRGVRAILDHYSGESATTTAGTSS